MCSVGNRLGLVDLWVLLVQSWSKLRSPVVVSSFSGNAALEGIPGEVCGTSLLADYAYEEDILSVSLVYSQIVHMKRMFSLEVR